MNFLRSLIFYILFYLGTTCFFLLFSPVRFFNKNLVVFLASFWSTAVIKLSKLILGISFEIRGSDNIPKSGSFVVASNHQSAWETFFFGSIFPGSVFILKHELKKIPIFSGYFKKLGFIFVKRDKAFNSLKFVLRSMKYLTKTSKNIFIIFPEGTRLKPEESVEINSGVFAIHKYIGLPILPIRLDSGEYWINKKFKKKSGKIKVCIFPIIEKELNKKKFLSILETHFYK